MNHTILKRPLAALILATGLGAVPLVASGPAFAVSENVPFVGSIGGLVCAFGPAIAGRLDTDGTDLKVLSSTLGDGSQGSISLLAAGNDFDLTIAAPTDWTADPADFGGTAPPTTTFAATYSASGATEFSGTNTGGSTPTSHDLTNGATTIVIDLEASVTANDFPAGIYRADVVVTCEV